MSAGTNVNGISINLFWNLYHKTKGISIGIVNQSDTSYGVQIGIINKTNNLKGTQIGLWNKNNRFSFPILNLGF